MSHRQTATALLLAGALLAATAGAAAALRYEEPFEAGKPASEILAGTLLEGSDGGWSGRLEEGAYVLSNEGEAGAVRYFHVTPKDARDQLETGVEVEIMPAGGAEAPAGAGLVYGFDPGNGSYWAFVVSEAGDYMLLRRDNQGLSLRGKGSNGAIRTDAPNALKVEIEGERIALLVNGERVLGHGGKGLAYGGAGLIAFGKGTFRFDDFLLSNE